MTSLGWLGGADPDPEGTAFEVVIALPSTVALGLPFFFVGPIYVSATISLSDSVEGVVEGLIGRGGLTLCLERACPVATVSLVRVSMERF